MIQTKVKVDYNRSYVNRKTTARRETQNDRLLVFSFIIFVLMIGLILFAYIGQSLQITQLNYTLNEKKLALEKIEQENHQLNLELARSTSLARVEKIARVKLKMVEPEEIKVVVLNNNQENKIIDNNKKGFFLAGLFDSLIDKIGTVQAGEL
ncbi:MAG: cell division protein FtsL [Halanaerobiales bacterium]|nr:cell division protein FtsL [Halanaerobiales bacterium]